MLGPSLFNFHLNEIFHFPDCNTCSFTDDTTSYVRVKNLHFVLESFEHRSNIALKWFEDRNMKMNSGKCHVFVSGNKHE